MIHALNIHMATAKQQPYSVGWAHGIIRNCFNRLKDSWFVVVGAGRDLSFLSVLKPELPGDECRGVNRRQSCHRINAFCDYLFKTPSDTLAVCISYEGRANKGGKKSARIPKRQLVKLFRSCCSCKFTWRWWHYKPPAQRISYTYI